MIWILCDHQIAFDGHSGDIVVVANDITDVITSGVVILTPDQARGAVHHGWTLIGDTPLDQAIDVVRLRR
jgi:hypothetical protein